MKKSMHGLILSAAASVLAGCTSTPLNHEPPAEDQQVSVILQKINDATAMAINAQQELALTADAKSQHDMALRRRLLTDVVSYDFFGDVELILKEISTKYGYDFASYGKRPPEGVNVNVFVVKKPVIEVLKQIGNTKTSVLDINLKREAIELHYKTK